MPLKLPIRRNLLKFNYHTKITILGICMNKYMKYAGFVVSGLFFLSILPNLFHEIKKNWSNLLHPKAKLAVVTIKGEITSPNQVFKQLHTYFNDQTIKGILLYIDCGGGAAGASQAIYEDLKALKAEYPKPIVTLTHNICASGAYYIATATDYIIAAPATIVGSIGSYIGFFGVKELLDKVAVKYQVQKSGQYKMVANPFVTADAGNQQLLQTISDSCYQQFITDVAASRKLDLKAADQWANGKIFTGAQAKQLGLVDELGANNCAINKLKALAKLPKEQEISWVSEPKPNPLAKLLGGDAEGDDLPAALSKLATQWYAKLTSEQIRVSF